MNTHVSLNEVPAASIPPAIRMLELNRIEPSRTAVQQRRRAHYDAASLAELAENIKSVQVIEPIIVRPDPSAAEGESFELVAGERRWRASGQAGLTSIPAIVRALDDSQVLEIQLIENLHREGLHELEEAEGYELLMQHHRYGVDELVAKLGRSRAYIYSRLKLLALDKRSRDAFYKGKLNASTALLLARIPVPSLQQEALKAITEAYNGEPMSFREAQRHIQERYMTRLKDAPFDTKLENLVAGAGPCGACPKLTGNQPELFGDVKNADVCTDPICYAAKRSAWAKRVREEAQAEGRMVFTGKDAKRIAPFGIRGSLQGGFVPLDGQCYEDTKRRTYRQLLGKDFKAETLLEDSESGRVVEIIKLSDHGEALKAKGIRAEEPSSTRRNDGDRARQKAAKLETLFRERVFGAIRAKAPTAIAGAELRLVVQALWHRADHDARIRLVNLWGWAEKGKAADMVYRSDAQVAKLSEADLRRLAIDCALVDEVRASAYDARKPAKLLEHHFQ